MVQYVFYVGISPSWGRNIICRYPKRLSIWNTVVSSGYGMNFWSHTWYCLKCSPGLSFMLLLLQIHRVTDKKNDLDLAQYSFNKLLVFFNFYQIICFISRRIAHDQILVFCQSNDENGGWPFDTVRVTRCVYANSLKPWVVSYHIRCYHCYVHFPLSYHSERHHCYCKHKYDQSLQLNER